MLANLRMAWYNEVRLCVALENDQVAITFPTRNRASIAEGCRGKILTAQGFKGPEGSN